MEADFELEAVFSEPHERTPSVCGSFPDGPTLCEVSRESVATTPAESAANKISAPVSHSQAISSRPVIARVGSPSQSQPTLAPHSLAIRKGGGDMSAYSLFLFGYDTFEIAKRLGITEARANERISLERDRLNGTRTEFEGLLA